MAVPLSARVREMRERQRMTQKVLATLADCSLKTIERIERGEVVRNQTLERVAEALGMYLCEVSHPDRFGILQAQADCIQLLGRVRGDSTLRTIAIDLTYGYENIIQALNACRSDRFLFQALILDTPMNLPGRADAVVQSWAQCADTNLDLLFQQFTPDKLPRGCQFQLKRYAEIPTIHGVALECDEETRYYITECFVEDNPVETTYFGDGDYMIFDRRGATTEQIARMQAFECHFAKLWNRTSEFAMNLSSTNR